MNALVVYDSQYGNTERIAQAIADALRPAGPVTLTRVRPAYTVDLGEVDLLVVGSPTQGWRPTPATQLFVDNIDPQQLRHLAFACFDTRFHGPRWMTGSAAATLDKRLYGQGLAPRVPGESFFVQGTEGPLHPGELERAAEWARQLTAQLAPAEPAR